MDGLLLLAGKVLGTEVVATAWAEGQACLCQRPSLTLSVPVPPRPARQCLLIETFSGETSCLSLCWAVLELFLAGTGGLG